MLFRNPMSAFHPMYDPALLGLYTNPQSIFHPDNDDTFDDRIAFHIMSTNLTYNNLIVFLYLHHKSVPRDIYPNGMSLDLGLKINTKIEVKAPNRYDLRPRPRDTVKE